MSRSQNLLQTAVRLLESYQSGEPFHLYLKNYFARNRKHGSTDRRLLRDLCYAYFRIGHIWSDIPISQRVTTAYYLVAPDPIPFLGDIHPDWPTPQSNDPASRALQLGLVWDRSQVFPWQSFLSPNIDAENFIDSLLQQPDLFIRTRPGHHQKVCDKLMQDGVAFRSIGADCLVLSNATSLESRLEIDRQVVVQDLSSQRIRELIQLLPTREHWKVWDACAASGGKSILLFDLINNISLHCTDLRGSILRNLQARLGRAQVPVMHVRSDDLTLQRDRSEWGMFDLILADVPCAGSGTWARTPEQGYSFDPTRLNSYASTQRSILQQLVKQLSSGGYLLYMTCSVFADENENQTRWIQEKLGLEMISQKLFIGYSDRADTLYGALFKRSA